MGGETLSRQEVDLTGVQLDVYVSKDATAEWWNPEHGPVATPEGWAFLPTGQAFVARTVKAAGVFWLAWQPRSRSRQHRRLLGIVAPERAIRAAEQVAADTEAARALRREAGARSRERQEARYQQELTAAIVDYLAFTPEHQRLAERIALDAAERAAVVGSGRVGRTRLLSLQERGALAARAQIRHAYTDYEQQLDDHVVAAVDDEPCRAIKAEAQAGVDDFLQAHRAEATGPAPREVERAADVPASGRVGRDRPVIAVTPGPNNAAAPGRTGSPRTVGLQRRSRWRTRRTTSDAG